MFNSLSFDTWSDQKWDMYKSCSECISHDKWQLYKHLKVFLSQPRILYTDRTSKSIRHAAASKNSTRNTRFGILGRNKRVFEIVPACRCRTKEASRLRIPKKWRCIVHCIKSASIPIKRCSYKLSLLIDLRTAHLRYVLCCKSSEFAI